MKNTSTPTRAAAPQRPSGFSRETFKTFLVIGILVLAFTNWNAVIAILINVMILIYTYVGRDFGLAIILFTILIRLITWPLNAQQMKGAKAMQELQNDKEWQEVQKKYAKDREKLAQEQWRIQQARGINPFASCLPTLVQFPILFALIPSITFAIGSTPLSILKLSRSLYSFQDVCALVPLNRKVLWMDLGLPERTLIFGLSIPVLAIIVALTTYVQTKLTMPATPSNSNDPTAAQTAAMGNTMSIYMPIMLYFLSANYAAGLSVYFVVSNILSIIQYSLMGRVNWRNLLPGGNKNPAPKK